MSQGYVNMRNRDVLLLFRRCAPIYDSITSSSRGALAGQLGDAYL
jgi:hypothetical protein